jgi:short-subunit dehydrogenase
MPTALITGGHGGIGYECARQLAVGPRFNLILAGRDLTRVEPAAQRLRNVCAPNAGCRSPRFRWTHPPWHRFEKLPPVAGL